jgi:drug/metabolite transporter (DMT)-like permease
MAIAWLGLLGTGFAFILYFYLIHSVGPTRTTLVTYIFPLVGLVLGVIVLGEKLDLRLVVGAGLIIISVAVVNQSS